MTASDSLLSPNFLILCRVPDTREIFCLLRPSSRRRADERLRYTDKFDDPNLPGQLQVMVTLKQVSVGTELNIVQEGLPDVIPQEACYLGWQESLRNLAKLAEPEIKSIGRRRPDVASGRAAQARL